MALAGLSLLLVVLLIVFGQLNRGLGRTAMEQQFAVNRGSAAQQIGRNLLADMGQVALRNTKMRDLLTRNGYTVSQNQPANQ